MANYYDDPNYEPWEYGPWGYGFGQAPDAKGGSNDYYSDNNGWSYDPYNDEYFRPDGDYSGGQFYPGNAPNVTFTATGWDDSNLWNLPQNRNPQSLLPGMPNGWGGPGGGGGGDLRLQFNPYPMSDMERWAPVRNDLIGVPPGSQGPVDPYETGSPTTNSTTNNNTTNNRTANISSKNVALESISNNTPDIASSVPESNPDTFEPQQIQSPRRMNPAGMDSGRRDGWQGPKPQEKPTASIYDPQPSKAGSGIPLGDGRTMPTSGQPGIKDMLTGMLQGVTGVDASSKAGARDSLLGLTGVNRYRDLIRNTRQRPKGQRVRNPYDPTI